MRKYYCITILLLFVVLIRPNTISTDSEYIEREEILKDLGLNILRIYNFNAEPLLFFNGYHQKGVIYLGDFNDIQHLYDYSSLDFILVKKNSDTASSFEILLTPNVSTVELQDDDNSIVVIDKNTILLELKRFKFIISNNRLVSEDIVDYDPQFFILKNCDDIEDTQKNFSVEHIFLVGDFSENIDSSVTVIPHNFYVQFMCNQTSYKYDYRKFKAGFN